MYVPRPIESAVIVAARATFPVPSNEIAVAVTKFPVIEKFLAFCSAVAIPAVEA